MRIGVYLRNLDEEYQFAIFRGIREQAKASGIELICIQLEFPWQDNRREKMFKSLNYLSLDGFLVISSVMLEKMNIPMIDKLPENIYSLPWVSLGISFKPIPSVVFNSRESLNQIFDHLLEDHGYRHFLYMGGTSDHPDNIIRETLFCQKMEESLNEMPELHWEIEHSSFSEASGYDCMSRVISRYWNNPFDVIVAANDTMALGVMNAIEALGNDSWKNTAVTGFDDIPQAAHFKSPLTTVKQPLLEMGRQGVRLLHDRINNVSSQSLIALNSTPMIRQSCGCPESVEKYTPQQDPGTMALIKTSKEFHQTIWQEHYLRQVNVLGQQMITMNSLQDILSILKDFLLLMGVHKYDLLLFGKKGDSRNNYADWVFHFAHTKSHLRNQGSRYIFLNDFFKKYYQDSVEDEFSPAVFPLISGKETLGLAVYQVDEYAYLPINSSCLFLANTLQRLRLQEKEHLQLQILEEEVDKRTFDLKQLNERLQEEAARRLDLEAQVLKISDMERLRFSLDLHDDICQRLAGIALFARSLSRYQGGEDLCNMLEDTVSRTREYAHQFFPVDLGELGLNDALLNLSHTLEQQSRSVCNYSWEGSSDIKLSSNQSINLYRITQEAVQNIIKHAKASEVDIRMEIGEKTASLTIRDNGQGNPNSNFELPLPDQLESKGRRPRGLGLRSMQYRTHQLDGQFRYHSSEKEGTCVEVIIPLELDKSGES